MFRCTAVLLSFLGLLPSMHSAPITDYPIQPVPFTSVRINGGFWQTRQETNRVVTIPFALAQCEENGRVGNFDLAAEVMRRRAAGDSTFQIDPPTVYPFDDTDLYKAIEAAAYVLSQEPDSAMEEQLDRFIERIAAAQEPDGYLYTFRTMHPDSPGHDWVDPDRWVKDPVLSHELYNLGHLYEAGVATFQATGKRRLLDICLRSAELVNGDFGPDKLHLTPGHQVIEMGLVKLYRVTGEARWLDLARFFLEERGPGGSAYSQAHQPVLDQSAAVGHAVRANYMYAGMADVAALTGNHRFQTAIDRIWDDVVNHKLYLTGGVGALWQGEAYGAPYELPADGYNETCAAIALMMWNHRMFLASGDSRYMDVFERTCYNGFLSGVSLTGDRFFYPNPLIYDGESKNNHGHAGRAPWFGCACCPPNLARTMASLSGYIYAVRDDDLFVNFYGESTARVDLSSGGITLTQSTEYPWKGKVRLTVSTHAATTFTLRLRIPGWARGRPVPSDLYRYEEPTPPWSVSVNGEAIQGALENGYCPITRPWSNGDTVDLDLPLVIHRVRGHESIEATRAQTALERGPLVYCIESIDNPDTTNRSLSDLSGITAEFEPGLLDGVFILKTEANGDHPLIAIPYYAWNNRGLSSMQVWLPREP